MLRNWPCQVLFGCILGLAATARAEVDPAELREGLSVLQQVGPRGEGHPPAVTAWETVSRASAAELTALLAAMNDDNPLACNWIRAAVDTIAERTLRQGDPLPAAELTNYLQDPSHSPRSRRLAFEWITRVDPSARDRLVPGWLEDPSLELRREAVAMKTMEADEALADGRREQAIVAYQTAWDAARDLDQIEDLTKKLRDLGQSADAATQMGFILSWDLVGPFDNTNTTGFDRVYPPEQGVDLSAEYDGKGESVSWKQSTTDDEYGMVDLNQALGKHKGAAAYAFAQFESTQERPVELRLGCINASKVWLNGELLSANHIYHSGTSIDQYVAHGVLKPGRNEILLKICQNEQTESWAQEWEFQLRVCDQLGTGIHSAPRSDPSTQ